MVRSRSILKLAIIYVFQVGQDEGGGGLEDIKAAIEQLTLRSQRSSSSYSSGSLLRHSSLETVNTTVTAADDFVWVDSHNR